MILAYLVDTENTHFKREIKNMKERFRGIKYWRFQLTKT